MATPTPALTPQHLTLEIDTLLTRYLSLLHTYTTLRSELNALQSSINLNLARANFSAERGVQYNASLYPSTMTASLICQISPPSASSASSSSSTSSNPSITISALPSIPSTDPSLSYPNPSKQEKKRTPTHIFGILSPSALKTAQKEAVTMVGDLVPRVVAVELQMQELEIEVRRRRKVRGRLEKREEEVVVNMEGRGSVGVEG